MGHCSRVFPEKVGQRLEAALVPRPQGLIGPEFPYGDDGPECLLTSCRLWKPGNTLEWPSAPVELLYYQGNWDITNTPCVAIVGTRKPSDNGQRRAANLAACFVKANFTVVSGLAQGIDTVAHTSFCTIIANNRQLSPITL